MAGTKKPTHVVDHRRLYMAVDGKLQHVTPGTQLVLNKKQADALGERIHAISDEVVIDPAAAAEELAAEIIATAEKSAAEIVAAAEKKTAGEES